MLYAQSAKSSLEFLKLAPQSTFSSELEALNFSDQLLKPQGDVPINGLFIDGIISIGVALSDYNFNTSQADPNAFVVFAPDIITENSFRIGHKWYFENETNFKSGIQIIWARIGLMIPLGSNGFGAFFPVSYRLAPLSIGSTNFIKFSEKTGLELNLNAGLNTSFAHRTVNTFDPNAATLVQLGVLINPSIKFRLKRLSIGLDIQYIHTFPGMIYSSDGSQFEYDYDVNVLLCGATIGYKF